MKPNIRLMNARVQKGLRQWQVAREIGIHESEFSKIESGRKMPSRELQLRIAGRLGVKAEDIFDNS